jgi:hypothetical protein
MSGSLSQLGAKGHADQETLVLAKPTQYIKNNNPTKMTHPTFNPMTKGSIVQFSTTNKKY